MVSLSGCGHGGSLDESAGTAPLRYIGKPTISAAKGRILLPLDRFGLNWQERRLIDYAVQLEISRCMDADGHRYPLIDRRREKEQPSRLFGVWTVDDAKAFGYAGAPPPAGQVQMKRLASRTWSPAADRILAACFRRARPLLLPEPLPGDVAAFRLYETAIRTPEARVAIDQWRRCLSRAGVPAPRPARPWVPAGLHGAAGENVAVIDVRCKQRNHLVPRLAEVAARVHRRWIETHQRVLARQRALVERTVRLAKSTIRAAPTGRTRLPMCTGDRPYHVACTKAHGAAASLRP